VSALVDLGRILARRSSWDAATGAFREAVSRARTVPEIADSYYDFADAVPYRRGDFEGTITVIEEGLARLPVDAGPARSRLLAVVGWCLTRMRRIEEALPIAREAYAALGDDPRPQWEIRVLDTLAMTLHYAQLEPERQLALLERALAVAVSSGNSTWEAVTAVHLGTLHVRSGRPALARPRCERGMELAHLIGDAYLEAIAAWALAEIAEELGDLHAAVSAREREVVLLASTGGNRHNEALARAHLAHLHRLLGDADTALAEAELARRCAAESAQPGYVEHIERAIACARWSDLVA
jgi:ATP/maltotriose-dependent transcriptional regulator MalT